MEWKRHDALWFEVVCMLKECILRQSLYKSSYLVTENVSLQELIYSMGFTSSPEREAK